MKFRGLILAIVVLAALVGALYWSNHRKPEESTHASADLPPKILSIDQQDITKIDIDKTGVPDLTLAREASGQWKITSPKDYRADQGRVSLMLSSLSSLASDRVVDDKASHLADYGLAQPEMRVTITEKGDKTHKLIIGDDTPTHTGAYAMLAGDPRVFTITTYSKASVNKTADDVRDLRLIPLDENKLSSMELTAKKQDMLFKRETNNWQIEKPQAFRTDSAEVATLAHQLTSAKLDPDAANQKQNVPAFASGTPVATAKLTGEGGTWEIQVRKNKNAYYAKSSALDGVAKLADDVAQAIDKAPEDFRNKNLFDFGYNEPDKVEVHDGNKTTYLTHSGDAWWSGDGKKLDPDSAENLLDKLRLLTATKFVNSGFTTPVLTIAVTPDNGKRTEKVQIAKSGDDYIARRDNDPALYELNPAAVTDLQKAANELKPAAKSQVPH